MWEVRGRYKDAQFLTWTHRDHTHFPLYYLPLYVGPLSTLPPYPLVSQLGGAQPLSQWQFLLLLHTFKTIKIPLSLIVNDVLNHERKDRNQEKRLNSCKSIDILFKNEEFIRYLNSPITKNLKKSHWASPWRTLIIQALLSWTNQETITYPMSMTLFLNVTVIIQNRNIYTCEISTDLKEKEVMNKENLNTLVN